MEYQLVMFLNDGTTIDGKVFDSLEVAQIQQVKLQILAVRNGFNINYSIRKQ